MRNGPVKDVDPDSGDSGYHSIYTLQKWINSKVYPPAKPKTAATKKAEAKPAQLTEREKKINAMCDWATKIAKSGKYKYKKWKNGKANTHKCRSAIRAPETVGTASALPSQYGITAEG